jgi:hypothetical protein
MFMVTGARVDHVVGAIIGPVVLVQSAGAITAQHLTGVRPDEFASLLEALSDLLRCYALRMRLLVARDGCTVDLSATFGCSERATFCSVGFEVSLAPRSRLGTKFFDITESEFPSARVDCFPVTGIPRAAARSIALLAELLRSAAGRRERFSLLGFSAETTLQTSRRRGFGGKVLPDIPR